MANHSDRDPIRYNGLNWEIRKDLLKGACSSMEESMAISEALAFAGGKGNYVNLDRILNSISSSAGRGAVNPIRAALTGDELDLPRLALIGGPIASKIAKYRLENASIGVRAEGTRTERVTVVRDDAKVIVSRRQSQP